MKLSVLIISFLSFAVYVHSIRKKVGYRSKFLALLMSVLLIGLFCLLGFLYFNYVEIGDRFEDRILLMLNEGDSSGRDVLAKELFEGWLEIDSVFNYLFGFEYMS